MSNFKDYSIYYDLLYKEKDYAAESSFIHALIRQYVPAAGTVLNLGCGTGNHDFHLVNQGYDVTGIDLSQEMIGHAVKKKNSPDIANPVFKVGDIRTVRLGLKFDVVISLFHVMSYQVSNDDLNAAFYTASEHLAEGGVFIFDCWYGPGVLTDPPAVRHRILENEALKVHRIAQPVMHLDDNYVDVIYSILVQNKAEQAFYEISETHKMRYLFRPEVLAYCSQYSLHADYLSNNIFSNKWNALFVCRK